MLVKRRHYRPIPKDAEIVERKGEKFARWTNSRGGKQTRPLNGRGDRIVVESRCWYVRLKQADGRWRETRAYTDKVASATLEAELLTKMERGMVGLVDPMEEHRRTPLKKHLEDFGTHLENKENTFEHVTKTLQRCQAVLDGIEAELIGDITAGRVETCLADLRRKGLSKSSSNHYFGAVRTFCRWLVKDRRSHENPVAGLSALKMTDQDKKRRRRNLTDEEFAKLVRAARTSEKSVGGLNGPDRAMLYILAANTGLRASELASLTPASFDLDSGTPTVRCVGAYTKNGVEAVLPLRADVVEMFRGWFGEQPKDKRLWPGGWARNRAGAAMLRADLKKAGVSYKDASGRYADFHSLRHTFISNLARGGVHPRNAQALARHSTIDLTMNVYTHTFLGDLASDMEKLPAVPTEGEDAGEKAAELSPTGTDGATQAGAPKGAQKGVGFLAQRVNRRQIVASSGKTGPGGEIARDARGLARIGDSGVKNGAEGGSRTHTPGKGNGILNPARLPIPPLRHRHIIASQNRVMQAYLRTCVQRRTRTSASIDRKPGLTPGGFLLQ